MPRRRQEEEQTTEPCAIPGCDAPGAHKAPRSRESLREYQWLCLDHVREFNKNWNYFGDMTAAEIESFMQDAVTGHRPTWERERAFSKFSNNAHAKLDEALHHFFHGAARPSAYTDDGRRMTSKERKALKIMELTAPLTPDALKKHYRELVKRYHPDKHQGSIEMAEKIKKINTSYAYLQEIYKV